MRPNGARDQPEPSHQQDQHDQSIEQARRLKVDVHVGNHSCQDEQRAGDREQPPDEASTVPKQQADADQHRDQCDAESIVTLEAPVRPDHGHLIGQEISSDAAHGEAYQEVAHAAGRPAHIAHTTVCHESVRISKLRRQLRTLPRGLLERYCRDGWFVGWGAARQHDRYIVGVASVTGPRFQRLHHGSD